MRVTPENVVAMARYLIQLDKSHIQKIYQKDHKAWSINLEKALNQYLNHEKLQENIKAFGSSTINFIEYHLKSLIEYTQAFLPLLTQKAMLELTEIFE